eukprot:TRINITY_DN13418_c0_g2_i1.p1 TRINITY_DN13418_c0_g2~~TRINITY_DN13418_c0_g2_i1.p1  ORF type:complete len:1145 (+),score=272.12 TRINITY_DN13418_c0_g2_i1:223-3435(+)
MDNIRKVTGICPQHDVIFGLLTVEEHLRMFGLIKGVPSSELGDEINRLIHDVGLSEKRSSLAGSLSGGQKRKLCLAMAFIGGSKLVILDEPTSGMDPYSRRSTWNIIKEYRQGRTIILTTHFMDEADQLGDRIVIMSQGRIICGGSSLFLKNLYGVGYTMTITKADKAPLDINNRLVSAVKSHVPTADILSETAGELSFRLPFSDSGRFPAMFAEIERFLNMGVQTYGISVTTLEEVFLRVASDEERGEGQEFRKSFDGLNTRHDAEETAVQRLERASVKASMKNDRLWTVHFKSLIVKRWHDAKRDRKVFLWQVLYPAILMLIGIVLVKYTVPSSFAAYEFSVRHQYDNPDPVPVAQAASGSFFKAVDVCSNLPGPSVCQSTNASESPNDFSQFLLESRDKQKETRFGAFQLWNGSSITSVFNGKAIEWGYDYMVLFNTSGVHSIPTYFNVMNNVRYKNLTGHPGASILLSSQVFPFTKSQITFNNATVALIVSIAFAFIPASFGAYIVKERSSKAKHQQLISGVSVTAYWFSNWVWDLVNFLIPVAILLIMLYAFNIQALISPENVGAAVTPMILYGLSITPFTYLICSVAFKDKTSAQNFLLLIYIVSGLTLLIASIVMQILPSTKDINSHLRFVYRLLPNYSFAEAISNLMVRDAAAAFPGHPGPWDLDITGYSCIYMACESVIYFALVLLVEYLKNSGYNSWSVIVASVRSGSRTEVFHFDDDHKENHELDEDVAAEVNRVNAGQVSDAIVLKHLRKVYPTVPAKVAVQNLSFGIPAGQCFGFLGSNGAGKTTTIRMLTLDEFPTSGEAFLNGMNILTDRNDVRHLMGYCPQFDALIDNLTSREHLRLYASIKGVDSSQVESYVSDLIEQLGLSEYADLPCKGYSGGNKRKLSVGIALIGDPPIVFLDEPSTGMDPKSRRSMWNLISTTMKGRSVILTTHSMEECEALCSRIGIMVNGQLRCLGSAQHLKSRFGNGFQLDVSVLEENQKSFMSFVESRFPGSVLLEAQDNNLKFIVPKKDHSLSELFSIIENKKVEVGIVEYSLSETSLEQIFLRFAKDQKNSGE